MPRTVEVQDDEVVVKVDNLFDALDFLDQSNTSGRRHHAFEMLLGRKTWDDWNKENS